MRDVARMACESTARRRPRGRDGRGGRRGHPPSSDPTSSSSTSTCMTWTASRSRAGSGQPGCDVRVLGTTGEGGRLPSSGRSGSGIGGLLDKMESSRASRPRWPALGRERRRLPPPSSRRSPCTSSPRSSGTAASARGSARRSRPGKQEVLAMIAEGSARSRWRRGSASPPGRWRATSRGPTGSSPFALGGRRRPGGAAGSRT